ncbi:MAG: FAD-binding oxidoreductase [Candidatus Dormiibacterota bacterium]
MVVATAEPTPKHRLRPATQDEVAEVLHEAAAQGEAVIPVGGGRLLGMGDPPERWDLALELGGLDRVIEATPADLTLTVEAGATVEQIDEILRPVGQQLPIDPPGGPGQTIGGVLASGVTGPLRQRFGAPREWVIGLRTALPDGRLAASGGRVVKNVSGYDMAKLHLGALGSLGVIVTASFKVFPRPAEDVTVVNEAGDVWADAERALALPQPPVALEVEGNQVRARFWGQGRGLRRMLDELGWSPAPVEVWRREPLPEGTAWLRVSVPPRHLREVLAVAPAEIGSWAWPGVGIAHLTGPLTVEDVRHVRAAAERAQGSAVLLGGSTALKREVGAWGAAPSTLLWMQRLRASFDPTHCLAPGRYVTG